MSKTVTMKIDGMHCKGCALGLQGALEKLPAVSSAKVTYPEQLAVVVWDSDASHEETLRNTVSEAGFKVETFQ